jgi:hypothetical protein
MFDFEPITEINGKRASKLRWIFLQPRKYGKRTSSASQSPMSRVGDGAAFSACNFAEGGSSRRDHLRRRNCMWGRSDIWPDPPVELKIAAELQPTTIKWRSQKCLKNSQGICQEKRTTG